MRYTPTHPLNHIKALLIVHPAEHHVLVVQPRSFHSGYKELSSVSVRSRVGHGQKSCKLDIVAVLFCHLVKHA